LYKAVKLACQTAHLVVSGKRMRASYKVEVGCAGPGPQQSDKDGSRRHFEDTKFCGRNTQSEGADYGKAFPNGVYSESQRFLSCRERLKVALAK
jgi:hypothetical protein